MKLYDLRVNYLKDPCGIDRTPQFSFKVRDFQNGDGMKRFSLCLRSADDTVWKADFDASQDTAHIPYTGPSLAPLTRYFFTVEAESALGEKAAGEEATFVTGKLSSRWSGKWITADFIKREDSAFAAPDLRRSFRLDGEVKTAYLVICGLGYFESFLNGQKTGTDLLSPGFTEYDKTDLYMVYDVKALLKQGKNALCVRLGNGWYNCFAEDPWNTRAATWRHWPKVICELHIEQTDGTRQVIVSDPSWKSHLSPITFNGIRNGEHYDARLEVDGWKDADFDDGAWLPTKLMKSPGGRLEAMELEPIRIRAELPAKKMWTAPSGAYLFDIGQNQAGVGRFRFRGPAGTEITIRYSDVLKENGELDQGPIGGFVRSHGFQTDKYIKRTDAEEVWNPVFTYHGFQYIELTGCVEPPRLSDVCALTLCTDCESIGSFRCSDDLLNQVQHMCRWSTISNLHSIPTDCPHREKNGWTGDTSLSSEQMLINFNTRAILSKWSSDLRRSQRPAGQIPCVVPSTGWGYYGLMGPDWSSALLNVPYNLYLYAADRQLLLDNYDAIKRNCDFMLSMTTDYTLDYGTGDWCAPFEGPAISVNMGAYKCPTRVSDTGFFYNAARTAARIAAILGEKEDESYYRALAADIRSAFREKLFDKETFTVLGDCQTATAVMLYFDLCEESERRPLIDKLIRQIEREDWHLDFGVLGCKFVMHSLGAAGEGSIGCRMLAQRTFPGCQRWVDLGATTLWECWNGGGSHNHHMFSDLSAFMYKYIGGISPDENAPGFRHTLLRPAVDSGFTSACAEHESMYGTVKCDWSVEGETARIELQIPFGCAATLYLPESYAGKLSENGAPLPCRIQENKAVYEIVSGAHLLTK